MSEWPRPQCEAPQHATVIHQTIILFQKLPWLEKKSVTIVKDFLRRKSNPRRASFRIKPVNGKKGQDGGMAKMIQLSMYPKSMGG